MQRRTSRRWAWLVWCCVLLASCAAEDRDTQADAAIGAQPDSGPPDAGVSGNLGDFDAGDWYSSLPTCPDGPARPEVDMASYPAVDGSTSTLPLARVIACALVGLDHRWEPGIGDEGTSEIVPVPDETLEQREQASAMLLSIVHNKTHDAYLNLIHSTADLILVANPPSPDERAAALEASVELDYRPIAQDALVVVVNRRNPTVNLTADEVRDIFLGRITLWDVLGDTRSLAPIRPYVRPENSGSQQLFNSIVLRGETAPAYPEDREIGFMGALLDHIKADRWSIGYSVYYYVTFQRPDHGYKVLWIDGIPPMAGTIATGRYPFVAPVWVVTRKGLPESSAAAALRDWLFSSDGQSVVAQSGYVPTCR